MSSNGSGSGQAAPRARIIKFSLPSLERRKKRRAVYSSERLVRSVRFMRYCLVFSASLFRAMAPWGLAVAEVVTMLLLYLGTVPGALVVHSSLLRFHYAFSRSLEDVVAVSLLRAAAVSVAYCSGAGAHQHRPYLWTAYAFALFGGPFAVAKLLAYDFPRHSAPVVLLMLMSLVFSGLHLAAAHNVVRWARHRADLGLDGFGYPWEEGEEAWFMLGRSNGAGSPRDGSDTSANSGGEWMEDVPPQSLADPDSKFAECAAFSVHVKEASPPVGSDFRHDTGVVLIHGYGSGVFAWRHIMQPLATQCGCRVVAFDRPAFGLTSRPQPPADGESPYSLHSAARLAVLLAGQLGLRRVVFVGHADGALVALLATATAAHQALPSGQDGSLQDGSLKGGSEDQAASKQLTESALRTRPGNGSFFGSAPTGGWASMLTGPLAPLDEGGDNEAAASPSGSDAALLPTRRSLGHPGGATRQLTYQVSATRSSSGAYDGSGSPASQDHHRDSGEALPETEPVAGPVSALAPSASAASLKLRGGGGSSSGSHSHTNSGVSSGYACGSTSAAGRGALPPAAPSAPPQSSDASDGTSSGPLTVVVVRGGRVHSSSDRQSDSATASDDFADDCGVYSPMLSPRRDNGGSGDHSRSASSAEEFEAVGAPFVFTPPSDQLPLAPVAADEWQRLVRSSSGQHYFASSAAVLEPMGVALLHPDLSGSIGPSFTRMLAKSKLGRRMLRPLLRSEVGEVSNRRAWHDSSQLTSEVLEHYKKPLRASNWDTALVEVSRLPREVSDRQIAALCGAIARFPSAVVTGDHDRVSPPLRAAQLAADLCGGRPGVLRNCGHLSHEESPAALLQFLSTFVTRCLTDAAARNTAAATMAAGGTVPKGGLPLQGSLQPPLQGRRNSELHWSGG